MSRPNIKLSRVPTPDDFCKVDDASARQCECTEELIANLKHGDEEICKPCAARQLLNGIASLAEKLG